MSVTIFTSKTCASCKMIKKYLEYRGVDYEEVNLDDHPERRQEAVRIAGVITVPITIVKNRESSPKVIVGYNPMQLASALA